MKREELTPIELECNMGKDINGVEHREPWKAYDITEVDQVLDEKDAEIAELKAALEDVKATAYAESVDAGMRERRLRRALYRVLALWANERARLTWSWRKEQGWLKMERKCRAMAEKCR